MKRGVRFGVSIPRALLAITPLSGVLSGAFEYRCRAGVPAADGVAWRKRVFPGGGASGIDCSAAAPSFISTSSSMSDDGNSRAGGDDIWCTTRCSSGPLPERDATPQLDFRAGFKMNHVMYFFLMKIYKVRCTSFRLSYP
jgi:hypothetical protein